MLASVSFLFAFWMFTQDTRMEDTGVRKKDTNFGFTERQIGIAALLLGHLSPEHTHTHSRRNDDNSFKIGRATKLTKRLVFFYFSSKISFLFISSGFSRTMKAPKYSKQQAKEESQSLCYHFQLRGSPSFSLFGMGLKCCCNTARLLQNLNKVD